MTPPDVNIDLSDPGIYTQITSLDDPPVGVDSSPGPVGESDPFPDRTDAQLEELRRATREQLVILSGHRGKTKQDAHDRLDRLYDEYIPNRIAQTLAANPGHFVDPMYAFAALLPHREYATCVALLAREEIDRPRWHRFIEEAPAMAGASA